MATKAILAYATLALTQGGNDTFVQGTITTGLSSLRQAWSIREILVEWGATTATGTAAGVPGATSMFGVGFSVKTLTALPLATDKSTLFTHKKTTNTATAVGFQLGDKVWRFNWSEDSAPLWVSDPLYIQNHSSGTGVALVANIRIGYVVQSISDADKASLLINALQA